MTIVEIFGDIAEVLAKMNPEKIIDLSPPKSMVVKVEELIYKKKDGVISSVEAIELERYLALDMLINLAKARAKHLIAA